MKSDEIKAKCFQDTRALWGANAIVLTCNVDQTWGPVLVRGCDIHQWLVSLSWNLPDKMGGGGGGGGGYYGQEGNVHIDDKIMVVYLFIIKHHVK